MKKILFSSVILSTIVAAGSASAADLAAAYNPPIPPPFNWTGFYVGVEGGGGAQWDNHTSTFGAGGVVGGEIGYNYQINSLVVGLEGEGFWANIKTRADTTTQFPGPPPTSFFTLSSETTNAIYDVAVRVGFTFFERTLLYGKLGAVWGDQSFSMTTGPLFPTSASSHSTPPGVLVGGGFEYAITNNWIARIETDELFFASTDATIPTSGAFPFTTIKSVVTLNTIAKIGVSYKF